MSMAAQLTQSIYIYNTSPLNKLRLQVVLRQVRRLLAHSVTGSPSTPATACPGLSRRHRLHHRMSHYFWTDRMHRLLYHWWVLVSQIDLTFPIPLRPSQQLRRDYRGHYHPWYRCSDFIVDSHARFIEPTGLRTSRFSTTISHHLVYMSMNYTSIQKFDLVIH